MEIEDQLKQLQREYDILDEIIDIKDAKMEQLKQENRELKQTLSEIKEIAECDCGYCKNYRCPRMDNILDLITKAESEEV